MDDMKISLSVPATIYSFGETKNLTQNQYVTHAKLKIFYIGQTEDSRVFTKQFSDQLLQTLPGTPVVAYYDEKTDDFNGHNPVQYVFGYVPETATIGYTEENGKTFAVTDVLLFTGRNDNIGMVANKIIGKSHSLELDPATVEYTIVRANSKLESITFNKGHFIGLSVLGNNEKPAFSGSSFFSADDIETKAFVDSFQEFKREVELYKSGGQEMQEENTLPIAETEVIVDAVEITVDTIAEAEIVSEEPSEETEEEVVEENTDEVEMLPMEEPVDEEKESPFEEIKEEETEEVFEVITTTEEATPEPIVKARSFEGLEDDRKETTTTKQEEGAQKATDSAALNQAERQELNEYRKKDKFALIDSYVELSDEMRDRFRQEHEKFAIEELDMKLAYELVKHQRQFKKPDVKVFTVATVEQKPETVADWINRYKDKK